MQTQIKLADILWDAANQFLCTTEEFRIWQNSGTLGTTVPFSCDAAAKAARLHCFNTYQENSRKYLLIVQDFVADFLADLGVEVDCLEQFDEFGDEVTQEVRYAWLMQAYQIALEEDIVVDINRSLYVI